MYLCYQSEQITWVSLSHLSQGGISEKGAVYFFGATFGNTTFLFFFFFFKRHFISLSLRQLKSCSQSAPLWNLSMQVSKSQLYDSQELFSALVANMGRLDSCLRILTTIKELQLWRQRFIWAVLHNMKWCRMLGSEIISVAGCQNCLPVSHWKFVFFYACLHKHSSLQEPFQMCNILFPINNKGSKSHLILKNVLYNLR